MMQEHVTEEELAAWEARAEEMARRPRLRTETPLSREVLADLALARVVSPGLRKRITGGKSAVVLAITPTAQWVEPVADAFREMSGGAPMTIIQRTKIPKDKGEFGLLDRIAEGRAIVGVSQDPESLPPVIPNVAEHRLVLPAMDASLVLGAIAKCQKGRIPASAKSIDYSLLDFDDVASVIVPDRSPRETVERLKDLITGKKRVGARTTSLPKLEDAVEYGEARRWALDLRDDIADWKAGLIPASAVDRGIVLSGPPGVGKTLYARMLGEACGMPTVIGSVGEFFASSAGYLDSVVKAQRALFDQARAQAPCILFLDEINALPNPDTLSQRGRDWWMPVILDFYILLDGAMSDREGIIVVGATNAEMKDLSPALIRPGRLERVVKIGPPDAAGAARIMRHHLGGELATEDLSRLGAMAQAAGATGAIIEENVRAARRTARRAGRTITVADLEGQVAPHDDRPADIRYRHALHESGHALLSQLLMPDWVDAVSLVARDGAGGSMSLLQGYGHRTRRDTHDTVRILLAGRAAEKIGLGEPSEGAGGSHGSDLALATKLIAGLYTTLGLEDTLVHRASREEIGQVLNVDARLRRKVSDVLSELNAEVEAILAGHREALEALAMALLQRRFLTAHDIAGLLGDLEFKTVPRVANQNSDTSDGRRRPL